MEIPKSAQKWGIVEACISKSPRFQAIDRTQIFLRTTDVESLIAEDHPARAIWIFLSRLDLSKFSEEQRAVEGDVGRSAIEKFDFHI